jgi:hypothetical protein
MFGGELEQLRVAECLGRTPARLLRLNLELDAHDTIIGSISPWVKLRFVNILDFSANPAAIAVAGRR